MRVVGGRYERGGLVSGRTSGCLSRFLSLGVDVRCEGTVVKHRSWLIKLAREKVRQQNAPFVGQCNLVNEVDEDGDEDTGRSTIPGG